MLEETWLQLALLATAGGVCAFAYLGALRATIFGARSSRLSLLGAVGTFIGLTALAFAGVWLVGGARPENLGLTFSGFVVVRALFGARICGSCEPGELFTPVPADETVVETPPALNSDLHWGAIAAEDVGGEGVEHGRAGRPEPFREYSTV